MPESIDPPVVSPSLWIISVSSTSYKNLKPDGRIMKGFGSQTEKTIPPVN
jgi:hypothetical protein